MYIYFAFSLGSKPSPFRTHTHLHTPHTHTLHTHTTHTHTHTHSHTYRVGLTTISVQKTRGDPWEDRLPKALFRGRDSNRERLDLVRLHRNETELFDVALTNWFFFEYNEELYGPKAKHISFHDFFKVLV